MMTQFRHWTQSTPRKFRYLTTEILKIFRLTTTNTDNVRATTPTLWPRWPATSRHSALWRTPRLSPSTRPLSFSAINLRPEFCSWRKRTAIRLRPFANSQAKSLSLMPWSCANVTLKTSFVWSASMRPNLSSRRWICRTSWRTLPVTSLSSRRSSTSPSRPRLSFWSSWSRLSLKTRS